MLRFMFFWDVGGDGGALRAHIVEKENTPKFHKAVPKVSPEITVPSCVYIRALSRT